LLDAGFYIGYRTGGNWKSDDDVTIGDMVVGKNENVIFKTARWTKEI
jgi:hypothetical protein